MTTKTKFKADELVVAVAPFVTEEDSIAPGDRRRGDDPLVKRTPKFWVADGSTSAEIAAARSALLEFEESPPAPAPAIPVERRLADADAAVSVHTGERIAKASKAVKRRPRDYAEVLPAGLKRRDAVLVRTTLTEVGAEGEVVRIAHRGTLIHKDDPFVKLHPSQVELPAYEREEA